MNQNEENNLTRLLMETIQTKMRDQDLANEQLQQQII